MDGIIPTGYKAMKEASMSLAYPESVVAQIASKVAVHPLAEQALLFDTSAILNLSQMQRAIAPTLEKIARIQKAVAIAPAVQNMLQLQRQIDSWRISFPDYPSMRTFEQLAGCTAALDAVFSRISSDVFLRVLEPPSDLNEVPSEDGVGGHLSIPEVFDAVTTADIFEKVSADEALDFANFLAEYPMLALAHPIGKRMFDELKGFSCGSLDPGTVCYRAREREVPGTPLVVPQMWEPSYGMAGQGRFNPHGLSVLYTSSSQEAPLAEIRKEYDLIADILRLEIRRPVKLLNLVGEDYPIFKYCRLSASHRGNMESSYLIPNFIAQCCQRHGIDCIANESVAHPGTISYTFFGAGRDWFVCEMVPNFDGFLVSGSKKVS